MKSRLIEKHIAAQSIVRGEWIFFIEIRLGGWRFMGWDAFGLAARMHKALFGYSQYTYIG
jgi:hypothetical protein